MISRSKGIGSVTFQLLCVVKLSKVLRYLQTKKFDLLFLLPVTFFPIFVKNVMQMST